ncbi:hypothetical protein LTR66_002824 [Elasticomyces elasticus]|nr:hypothetical protein LTR28_007936 [Elasticomyces elasticus]KAK4983611.1 hypothetical protein LTR50_007122 [Elasticomyces elasticus]KAK4997837.1 hypothetical protein LTR66_002824 [Elasticomyces elasticus]
MSSDDLSAHASSDHDFYDLLGVTFETSPSDIRRAYRRTALKYHPDKNAGDASAVEKFHLLQIAYDVLSTPSVKALYDNARRARKEKEERHAAYEGRRREMKDDLERRESGFFKRQRDEHDEEEKLERAIRRFAEDGKRRRMEMEDMMSRGELEEQERQDRATDGLVGSPADNSAGNPMGRGGTEVPEIDRTVQVRWMREGPGANLSKEGLQKLFSRFGPIESTLVLKDRKQRAGEREKKKLVARGVVVFASIVGAHAAVEDTKRQGGAEYAIFDSVSWVGDQEPEAIRVRQPATPPMQEASIPSTPVPGLDAARLRKHVGSHDSPVTPALAFQANASANSNNIKRVPSFASFSATPQNSPSFKPSAQSPSLHEITMIRLKNAEKKRLEDQIRREEMEGTAAKAS